MQIVATIKSYFASKFGTSTNIECSDNLALDPLKHAISRTLDGNKITRLDLSARGLSEVGSDIQQLRSLLDLSLASNHLSSLSLDIGVLSYLVSLDLSNNSFTEIPICISSLKNLKTLNISCNSISHLPEFITELRVLRTLNLSDNNIRRLPSRIGRLESLVNLHINNNPIENVPVELIRNCKKLEYIDVSWTYDDSDVNAVEQKDYHMEDSKNGCPSLKELCARAVLCYGITPSSSSINRDVLRYLRRANTCSDCRGPYFETCYEREHFAVLSGVRLKIIHSLCSPHWSDNQGRIKRMFCSKWKCPMQKIKQMRTGELHYVLNGRMSTHFRGRILDESTSSSNFFSFPETVDINLTRSEQWINNTLKSPLQLEQHQVQRLKENKVDSFARLSRFTSDTLMFEIGMDNDAIQMIKTNELYEGSRNRLSKAAPSATSRGWLVRNFWH